MIKKIVIAIPARLESQRLPKKIIADICGKPMIKRVLENCIKAKGFNGVILCTDNLELNQLVKDWGYSTLITSSKCQSGSERIASVIDKIVCNAWDLSEADLNEFDKNQLLIQTAIVNVQGDQPFINPEILSQISKKLLTDKNHFDVITPVFVLPKKDIHNPAVVKTLLSSNNQAIYFSRSALPHVRGVDPLEWYKHATYWGHAGIYAYRAEILKQWFNLPESKLEKLEKLEQLKILEAGYKISTFKINENSLSVDTYEQLEEARRIALKLEN